MSVHAGWFITGVFGIVLVMWTVARYQNYRWQAANIDRELSRLDTLRPASWGSARVDEDPRLVDTTTTIRRLSALADPCPVCKGDHAGACEDQPIEGVIVDAAVADDSQWRWDDVASTWLPPRAIAEAAWYRPELVAA